jgi:hypothetical protein
MNPHSSFVGRLGLGVAVLCAYSVAQAPTIEKKIVEYGWDVPAAEYVRGHIREMEQRPFDGVIFRLEGKANVLEPAAFDESAYAKDFDNLANISWEKFTDNFLMMWAASEQDWFDDAQWEAIAHNTSLIAKAARTGKCVGICFDPEPYGKNPWSYKETAHKDTKSFAEYGAKVRERGVAFIRAIEQEFPHPKILSFYQLALFAPFCGPMSDDERAAKLESHDYALYPAFFMGMLEAASPETAFIDGNESAYYYHDALPYFEAYHLITQRALNMVGPALRAKYRAQVQVGQALYVDQYFGLRAQKVLGDYMTPTEQPKWFEHNVYWAMQTSDRYVWCYSERMNWWTDKDVPQGALDALRSGREKANKGEPLGFDLRPIAEAAARRERGETAP